MWVSAYLPFPSLYLRHLARNDFAGDFFHSTDGGATWALEQVPGLYILDLDMPSPTVGYAVALTAADGVGLLKYDSNP